MKLLSPIDVLFLTAESHEHPLHVGGLQLFKPPTDAGPEFAGDTYESLIACQDVASIFRKHPGTFAGFNNAGWVDEAGIDLEYHVRRSALPTPGRVRELLELTSRLHATALDRHRPLWETHLIEGLADGRFAVYFKIHHSLVDGVSALKLLQRSLNADPDDGDFRAPWSPSGHAAAAKPPSGSPLHRLTTTVGSLASVGPSALKLARAALVEQQLTLPGAAPRTMFNVPVGAARRTAAQSWPLERVKAVKDAAAVSVNDVVLAMSAGALRSYLIEHNALPDAPLTAMVPINLRNENDALEGNVVTAVLADLATHMDDPARRLEKINTSMRANKAVVSQLPRAHAIAMGMGLLAPAALNVLPGVTGATPPPFNICISNVPAARKPLYLNGAQLDGTYPLSIVLNGQALNITLTNSADSLDFGLVGCRRSVPHLQRLLGHLETALKELEKAVGV